MMNTKHEHIQSFYCSSYEYLYPTTTIKLNKQTTTTDTTRTTAWVQRRVLMLLRSMTVRATVVGQMKMQRINIVMTDNYYPLSLLHITLERVNNGEKKTMVYDLT
jgi:ABC-type ATPase with predicted acetyltransferase domain